MGFYIIDNPLGKGGRAASLVKPAENSGEKLEKCEARQSVTYLGFRYESHTLVWILLLLV